mmetsp:Transcript_6698/g.7645  ORF Transcript_6698/g.7645 Transcript_6698/m.7645 type:complete len:370 (+) Transcript_6698:3-1112(+)
MSSERVQMGGVVVDVSKFLHALTLDIVCMTVFQEKLGAIAAIERSEPDEVVDAFKFASDEMARRCSSMNPFDWLYWLSVRPSQQKLNKANKVIRERVQRIINRRISRGFQNTDDDLLHHMLVEAKKKAMEGKRQSGALTASDFTDPSISGVISDNVVTMMWAGHDTTASGLSFSLYRLAKHIHFQERLREEIKKCKEENGLSPCEPLSHELVMRLPFLNAIVMETLRLHPPALWTNRGISKEITLYDNEGKGVTLPVGSSAFIPVYAVHHSEQNWKEPEIFMPERFLTTDGKQDTSRHHPYAFVPFGGGNRVCPGQTLALFEFKTILYTFIERFRFNLVQTGGVQHEPTISSCGMFQDCVDNRLLITPC